MLEKPFPGCMYASYLHQSGLFDEEIINLIRDSMLKWRARVKGKLEEVVEKYPLQQEIDLESLAAMLLVIFEGAFVLLQSVNEAKTVSRQLSHYHRYLQLLFNADH